MDEQQKNVVDKKMLPKKIGLKQMYQKEYCQVPNLTPEMLAMLGEIEDAFDMIFWGHSGSGKTNISMETMCQLVIALQCKATYISWEEGHGKSLRNTIVRHNLLDRLGNRLEILDGGTFEQVYAMMKKRKSAKIWVFDSLQASHFTVEQTAKLKTDFVLSKKKKILIYISWAKGKEPHGAVAESVRYYANIKIFTEKFIAFPTGRFGGNKNYIIWADGAKKKWGNKLFNKHKNS
jgi:hypothetical protein